LLSLFLCLDIAPRGGEGREAKSGRKIDIVMEAKSGGWEDGREKLRAKK
jgi:hypothetical protein